MNVLKVFSTLLVAILLQMLLRRHLESSYLLDLTMVAVVYCARPRTRIQSTFIGSAAGLLQDGISALPLGMNGFTKTVAGYLVAVLCGRFILESYFMQFVLLATLSFVDMALKLALCQVFGLPLPSRFLTTSFSQAFVTGCLGSGLLISARAIPRWKSGRTTWLS